MAWRVGEHARGSDLGGGLETSPECPRGAFGVRGEEEGLEDLARNGTRLLGVSPRGFIFTPPVTQKRKGHKAVPPNN
jgi:hypothetical protein